MQLAQVETTMSNTETVTFANGRRGSYWCNVGIVTGHQIWSETHVSSSGGGGYVGSEGGQVHAPVVSSTSRERSRYYLKLDNGNEIEINDGVRARNGHRVAQFCGDIEGRNGSILGMTNLSTGTTQDIRPSPAYIHAFGKGRIYGFRRRVWLLWLPALLLLSPLFETRDPYNPPSYAGPKLFLLFAVAFLVICLARRMNRVRACNLEFVSKTAEFRKTATERLKRVAAE